MIQEVESKMGEANSQTRENNGILLFIEESLKLRHPGSLIMLMKGKIDRFSE